MAAPRPRQLVPHLLICTLLALSTTRAALTNLTIDDSDLSYFTWTEDTGSPAPTLPWAAISPTTPCLYCSAQPQTADIQNQTWHDGSNNSAGSFAFQGSAVYIYGIDLANPANISFTLDGTAAGFHYYAGSAQFIFRSLFFSAADLSVGENHTVQWVLHTTKTNGSTGLLDYAIITVDESTVAPSGTGSPSSTTATPTSTKPKSKSKTGPIVGGVIGGLALIAIVILGLLFLHRRRRRSTSAALREGEIAGGGGRAPGVQPFMAQSPGSERTGPSSATGEKTLDVSWLNPAPAPSLPSAPSAPSATVGTVGTRSTTDVSSIPATALTNSSLSAPTDPSSRSPPPTDAGTSTRERVLENRLAQLEAHVAQLGVPLDPDRDLGVPPPYVPPPEGTQGMGTPAL